MRIIQPLMVISFYVLSLSPGLGVAQVSPEGATGDNVAPAAPPPSSEPPAQPAPQAATEPSPVQAVPAAAAETPASAVPVAPLEAQKPLVPPPSAAPPADTQQGQAPAPVAAPQPPAHQATQPAPAVPPPPPNATGATHSSRALQSSREATGRNTLGISSGLASGVGVEYRRYLTNIVALRVAGGAIASDSAAVFSLGVSAQEDFWRTYYYRLYGVQALGFYKAAKGLRIAPGAGVGLEYDFKGMHRGLCLRGELVLTPLFDIDEGVTLFTLLPQAGAGFTF